MKKTVIIICGLIFLFVLSGCAILLPKAEHFKEYRKLCKQNDSDACYKLGVMYMQGIGTQQSFFNAKKAFKIACENGNNNSACLELGKIEAVGIGEQRDDYQIKHQKKKIVLSASEFNTTKDMCDKSNGEKCYNLGDMYEKGIGVEKNIPKAIEAYRKGCETRHKYTLDACSALGKLYLYTQHNYSKAKQLLEHTCKDTFTKGCGDLGQMYLQGKGIKQDNQQAIVLLKKGCEYNNDIKACSTLGSLYITGQYVKEDYESAYTFFDKACSGGDALACYNMGNMYENGIGRAQNRQNAIQFYSLACNAGLEEGCENLRELKSEVKD